MTQNVPTHYVQQYTSNVQLLLQQLDNRLAGYVTRGNYVGKGGVPVDQIGAIEAQQVTSRLQPLVPQDVPTDRRWVYPSDWDTTIIIDSFDKLRLLTDPTNEYVKAGAAALKRKMDDIVITAFFADAKTGEAGGTTTSFPSGQQVGVNVGGTASGLNFAKLREAREILMANEVDPDEELFVAVTADEMNDLMNEPQLTTREFVNFSGMSPVESGRIMRAHGFMIIETQRLATDGSNYRRVPVWSKLGMHLGVWDDLSTDIFQSTTIKKRPYVAYSCMTIGATRVEEKRVVEIKCA